MKARHAVCFPYGKSLDPHSRHMGSYFQVPLTDEKLGERLLSMLKFFPMLFDKIQYHL